MRDDLGARAPHDLALAWADHGGEPCLRLTGLVLGPGYGDGFAVVAGEDAAALADRGVQPAAGRFVRTAQGVDFVPRFPFLAGTAYSLIVRPCAAVPDGAVLTLRRDRSSVASTAVVIAVHPDVETVPLNLLKLYVRFSEPMAEGAAKRGVRVEDARTGAVLDGVFLDIDPELWDPERRRLTLLLDPGRIKRGLGPHQEAGYPLREGVSVRLTLGAPFVSAAGAPLRSAFVRTYEVGPALRRPIDPADWSLDVPDEGSLAPLQVDFDRPLDHAMLAHAFQVVDEAGGAVVGAGKTTPHAMGWRFQPATPWRSGQHSLIVDARLEDLAGNSLRRVFDRDLTRNDDFVTAAEQVVMPLRRRP